MSYFKVKDPAKRDFLINDYLKLRRKVKSDLQSEKIGEQSLEESLARTFKPITDSQIALKDTFSKELQPIARNTTSTLQSIQGMKEPLQSITYPFATYPLLQDSTDTSRRGSEEETLSMGELALRYLSDTPNRDKTYGINHYSGKFRMGDRYVYINDNNIYVKNDNGKEIPFIGTAGLWELIQIKEPDKNIYTNVDLKNYAKLKFLTNSIRRNNNPKETHPKQTKAYKWNNILKPIWDAGDKVLSSGSGIEPTTSAATIILPQDPEALN